MDIDDKDKSSEELDKQSADKSISRIIKFIPKEKVHGKEVILKNKKHRAVLKEYYEHCKSQNDSNRTIVTKFRVLKHFFLTLNKDKPEEAVREDIEKYFRKKSYLKPTTLNLHRVIIKTYFRWLYKLPPGEYPEVVDWLNQVKIKDKDKQEKQILTKEEIKKILQVTTDLRDNCLISVIYDGALRAGEAANLKIKDVIHDVYGCKITVNGKTGRRTIRLVNSVPVLKQWLNKHPFKNDSEHAVFICQAKKFGQPLLTNNIYKVIEAAVKRAGINKKAHPHLFRHTKLTELANEGFNEMDLRIYAGWNKRSNMPEIYLHNNERMVDEKMRSKNGLINKEEEKRLETEKKILKPKECPMCEELNDVNNKFCYKCGQILDIRAIRDIERAKEPVVAIISEDVKKKLIEDLRKRLLADILKEVRK